MFECTSCGAQSATRTEICSCGAWRSLRPVKNSSELTNAICPPRRTRGELVTARQLAVMERTRLNLSACWADLLGSVAPIFSMMVYGLPGHGKSSFLLAFAYELCRLGNVLYVAAEEGQSSSMIEKINRYEFISDRLHISSAISIAELTEDLNRLEKVDFLFIDSLASFPITLPQLSEIVEARRMGVAFSQHATKEKNYRGKAEWGHWVDVTVRMESSTIYLEKNRFGPLKNANLKLNPMKDSSK